MGYVVTVLAHCEGVVDYEDLFGVSIERRNRIESLRIGRECNLITHMIATAEVR